MQAKASGKFHSNLDATGDGVSFIFSSTLVHMTGFFVQISITHMACVSANMAIQQHHIACFYVIEQLSTLEDVHSMHAVFGEALC